MTTTTDPGTVLITGPTGGLGRALAMGLAARPAADRPDLLLLGRPGERLDEVARLVRAAGATAESVPCDLSRLADVREAAAAVRDLLAGDALRPLRVLVANAGVYPADTRTASSDGYQLTFAINYLAHAQLIGDLLHSLTPPARIIMIGSNTYRGTLGRRLMGAPGPNWRDPLDIAEPAGGEKSPGMHAAGVAYATSKLAILYYAHELQRHAGSGINVIVFEPGFMPGTGIGRDYAPMLRAIARSMSRLPGMSSPRKAMPPLASLVLDDRWSALRDGAYVVLGKETKVLAHACDPERERRLWEATDELLRTATTAA